MLFSKWKQRLLSVISVLLIILLVIYSETTIQAVKEGLALWINHVVPSLFPFFVATEILCQTNVITFLGKLLNRIVRKVFHVPGEGAFALIMGTICGYPSGAKIVANLKSQNILTIEEAERLIAFTNNSGPLFILGTVGISLFHNPHIGYVLLISHLLSCLIVGVVFKNWKKSYTISSRKIVSQNTKEINIKDIGDILNNSIKNSITTIVNIGGFIVLFSVIISLLKASGFLYFCGILFEKMHVSQNVGIPIVSGMIELTNGVKSISLLQPTKLTICITSFLIGFGGLSVLFQVYSIIAKENISIKPYFWGKLLQGVLSFFLTSIFL